MRATSLIIPVVAVIVLNPSESEAQTNQQGVTVTLPRTESQYINTRQQNYNTLLPQDGVNSQSQKPSLELQLQQNLNLQTQEAYKNSTSTPRMKQLEAEEKQLRDALYGSPGATKQSKPDYYPNYYKPSQQSSYSMPNDQMPQKPNGYNSPGNGANSDTTGNTISGNTANPTWQRYVPKQGAQTLKQYMNSGQYWKDNPPYWKDNTSPAPNQKPFQP